MRGRDLENNSGARSRRAGPVNFKSVPRPPSSQREGAREPNRTKTPQRSTRKQPSNERRFTRRRMRTRDRIDMTERKRSALDDVATFRVVSVRDLVEQRFGGNAFAARQGINALKDEGMIDEHTIRSKSGKTFRVLSATNKGRKKAWSNRSHPHQRYWSRLAKSAEIRHDTAVYRAARSEVAKLEKSGAKVKRIQLDYEMKSRVSKIARGSPQQERREGRS